MSECPNASLINAIFTPDFFKTEANECLAVWKERSNMSNGN